MALIKLKKKPKEKVKPKLGIDLPFLLLVLIILTIGLIMLFSASYAYAFYYYKNSLYFISRQFLFAVAGVAAMLIISKIDYHILRKFAIPGIIGSFLLLIVVLFMPELNGAKRWIFIGPLNFQPSEVMKFAVVLFFSQYVSVFYKKMGTFVYGVIPFVGIFGITAGLMLLQPHLSGTILIGTLVLIMMIVGGTKFKWFALAGGFVALALAVIVLFTDIVEYAMIRVKFWQDPFLDAQGKGYQTIQSLLAIGSGGLMGVGLGNSRQKYLYIPEPQNDFVFSVVCEELGFIGATLIIILFVLLVVRGFVIASRASDKFGCMLAVGLTAQVGLQAALNIAVVTNTIPNTGISLPFFSAGGTALMMLLAQMGIVLSVSRYAALEKT